MGKPQLHVYVAGAWSEQMTRAKPAMSALRKAGIVVTHDWTLPGEADLTVRPEKTEQTLSAHQRRGYALADLRGVRQADLVWLVVPPREAYGAGCFFEAGAALVLGIPLFVSGPEWRRSIFCELAAMKFETDAEALAAIVG
jgi:hypothetical protein